MKYKRYPKVKDSGVEGIGDIPEGWEIRKIKFTSYVKGRIGWQGLTSEEYIEEGPYLITGTDFKDGKINWKSCHHVEQWRYEQDPYIQIKNNDILITKDGTIGKIAFVEDVPGDATLNTGVLVVRPLNNSILPKFQNWIFNSRLFIDFIEFIKSGTTINHLYQEEFGKFTFPVPPIDQQEQIYDFLENKTTQFDELIAKSKAQITLLEEKKQATINQAVTKGLDPSVPMKDSGVEWIGEIPEEWEVRKLKQIGYLKAGGTPFRSNSLYWNDGIIPWISSGEVNYSTITSSREKITKLGLEKSSATKFPIGTVLVAITGEGKTRGQSAILEIEAATNQSVIGIVHDKKIIHNSFLFLYFQSQYLPLRNYSHGSVQSGLNLEILKNYPIVLPTTIKEQTQIFEFLKKQTIQFDELIAKSKTQITLLQEKRQALITAAVTGKIDVRGRVA